MTALRQEVIDLVQSAPEEVLQELIYFMQDKKFRQIEKESRLERKRIAFEELKSLSRPIPDFDEEKAKAEYMEEQFGV